MTIVEAAPRLIAREEPFASRATSTTRSSSAASAVRVGAAGGRRCRGTVRSRSRSSRASELTGDELLVAVGRRPATRDLGLETFGLEPGRSGRGRRAAARARPRLALRDRRRQRPRAAHAHGQVPGPHRRRRDPRPRRDARRDTRAARCRRASSSPTRRSPPSGTRSLSAQQAGIDARSVDTETSGGAGGSFYGRKAPGTSRLVVDEKRRVVVGATFVGADVSEFVHAATIAVVGELTVDRLWHAVPSFPTRSEIWLRPARGVRAMKPVERTRPPERGAEGPRALAALGALPLRARLGHRARGLLAPAATRGATSRTTTPARAPTAGARTGSPASATTGRRSASRSRSGTAATRS